MSTGLLLDIICSHNKSSSYTNIALLSNSQQLNNLNHNKPQKKQKQIFIESDPETKQSGGSEYLSAKEWTEDHPQPKHLYESDSESEELDPLASSTIIEVLNHQNPDPRILLIPSKDLLQQSWKDKQNQNQLTSNSLRPRTQLWTQNRTINCWEWNKGH